MRTLALDMTICNTGYSVWEWKKSDSEKWSWLPIACGCISPAAKVDKRDYQMVQDFKRCQELARELEKLIDKHCTQAVVVELLEGSQSSRPARTFGLVTGVLSVVVEQRGLPIYSYRAVAVKKSLTGRKNASKDDIIDAVLELFPDFCKKNGWEKKKSPKTGIMQWPTKLEHVADSMGLFQHAEDQSDFRMVTQMAIAAQASVPANPECFMEDSFFD